MGNNRISPDGQAKPANNWAITRAVAICLPFFALAVVVVYALTRGGASVEPSPEHPLASSSESSAHDRRIEAANKAMVAAGEALNKDRSDANLATLKESIKAHEDAIDAWARPYAKLIEEAQRYFANPDEIPMQLYDAEKRFRSEKFRATPTDLLRGGIFLVRDSRRESQTKQSFQMFITLYSDWRTQGLDHTDTIKKLYELEKF